MYQISNQQHVEVVSLLEDYLTMRTDGDSLKQQNRFRRAWLLLKALKKRKPI